MLQHLIVFLIFALCLYFAIRRILRIVSRAKKGDRLCSTCAETDCPLHQSNSSGTCDCGCREREKTADIRKNCKKTKL